MILLVASQNVLKITFVVQWDLTVYIRELDYNNIIILFEKLYHECHFFKNACWDIT